MPQERVAFIKTGSFSHVNENVANILAMHFSNHEIEIIDVEKDLVNTHDLINVILAAKEYAPDILLGRKNIRHCLLRTIHIFKEIKAEVSKRLSQGKYIFTFQTQSLFDASVSGIPHFVYTDHTNLANLRYPQVNKNKLYSKAWIHLEKTIYQNASMNFTTGNFAATSIIEDYDIDPAKVACVYSGINIPANLNLDRPHNHKNILFVGVRWERKGGPELMQAFKQVLKVHPDAQLTIVGCSPQVDVPNCRVVGLVPREEVAQYYENASVFCMPSKLEPSAVALIEASAYGLPVVSTNVGGTPDRVLDGQTGYLVTPGDIARLAKRLVDLLDDPEKCKTFGGAGYQLVMERYTWDKVGYRIKENITTMLGQSVSW